MDSKLLYVFNDIHIINWQTFTIYFNSFFSLLSTSIVEKQVWYKYCQYDENPYDLDPKFIKDSKYFIHFHLNSIVSFGWVC
jgi:hypothetical protein